MIAHISGRLVEKSTTNVVIECQGVGYDINISLYTLSKISEGEQLKLFTFLQVKEDSHTLWGFIDKLERELFKLLISVSGIGGNIARTMLSTFAPTEIINAIATEDVAVIKSVKGVGPKTAQRVIIDLKDKVNKIHKVDGEKLQSTSNVKEEALAALETLGFNRKMAQKVVDGIVASEPDLSVENILKQALKKL